MKVVVLLMVTMIIIHVAQDRDRWLALVNLVMNIPIP
jgi:hypothetical protein